jgi:Zn-dependent protease
VGATIVLTAFHFTDNIVNVDTYPRQDFLSATFIQVAGLIFWPVMASIGVAGYLLYRRGRIPLAHAYLIAFSFIGLVSLGHFTAASPGELTTRGLVSVTIDGIMGVAVIAVTLWSILARRREVSPPVEPTSATG